MARLTDVSQQQRVVPRLGGRVPEAPIARAVTVGSTGPGFEALGQSLVKGGEEIYRAQVVEEDRINRMRAEEAYNVFLSKKIDLTVGAEGFTQLKGSDAVGAPVYKDYTNKLMDSQRQISQALSNDEQKRLFSERADVAQLQYKEGILRHLSEQTGVYAQAVHEGTLATAGQDALLNAGKPVVVEAAQARIKNSVDEQADLHNWPPEYRDAVMFDEQSKVYEGVIYNLIDNDPVEARARYDQYKDKIDGTKKPAIEKALKTGGLKQFSQAKSDEILLMVDDEAPEDEFIQQSKKALDEANSIADAEKRDATVKRVTSGIDIMTKQRALREGARADSAWEVVLEGGNLDSLPVSQLEKMRATDAGTVIAMEKYIAQREKGTTAVTDWSRYYVLEQMAADDPQGFAALDLRNDLANLAPTQFSTISGLQRSTKAALGTAEEKSTTEQAKRATYANARSVSKDLLESAGIDTTPKTGTDEAERLAQFYDALLTEIEEEQALQKGKMTEEQIRATASRLLKVHEEKWIGDDVLAFEAPIEDIYASIPEAERRNLESALVARGQSMSRENVVRQYQRIQRLERAKAARAVRMIPP